MKAFFINLFKKKPVTRHPKLAEALFGEYYYMPPDEDFEQIPIEQIAAERKTKTHGEYKNIKNENSL